VHCNHKGHNSLTKDAQKEPFSTNLPNLTNSGVELKESVVGVFNIACGKRTSLNQLARVIMDIMGSEAAPIHDRPRKGDIQDSVADISAARMGLDFEPDYDLVSGLSKPPGLIFQLRLFTTEPQSSQRRSTFFIFHPSLKAHQLLPR
jgi:hypothetical protein